MKNILLLVIFVFSMKSFSQNFTDIVDTNYVMTSSLLNQGSLLKTTSTTVIKEVVIIARDPGSGCYLDPWFDDLFSEDLPTYYTEATHGNFSYEPTVLKKDLTHAFELLTVPVASTNDHGNSNINHVLSEADAIYNFADYDWDGNDIVEVHFTSIGPGNWGVVGNIHSYISNDPGISGNITLKVLHQSRGINRANYYGVIVHENGHYYFGLKDQEHSGYTFYNHWGLGSFDPMSNVLGFYLSDSSSTQPSAYNPVYSDILNWLTPKSITSNQNDYTLSDYQSTKSLYLYEPTSLPSNAVSNERFYITYIQPNKSYTFDNFPITNREEGAVIIWHVKGNGLIFNGTFTNWYSKDIDIEVAHGKTIWTGDEIDTGVEDPINGRDKLDVRKVVGGKVVGGPYYLSVEVGDESIMYLPGDGKDFNFYSNPNSNWYNNGSASYAQNILSGFEFKNFNYSSGTAKADIILNHYSVDENTILAKGTWYINNDITVSAGVTLTIQEGTELIFKNGARIIINGTLNVNGTISNKVIFDFTSPNNYNGIKFYYGSSGTIDNAIIKNAFYGIYLMNSAPTIKNSEIHDCSYGIVSYYNSPAIETNEIYDITNYGIYTYSGSPTITDNYIHNTNNYGITVCSSTNTYIRDNTIKNCKGGVYAYGNETIHLHGDGLNKIEGYTSSGHAVFVTGGTANLGEYHSKGKNSFIRNTLNTVIYNSSTNEVLAEKNYWGGSPQSSWFYGNVSWDFPLSSPASGVGSTLGKTAGEDITPDRILFSEAMELLDLKEFNEASKKFKQLVKDYPGSRFAGLSVAWAMSSEKKDKEFSNQLNYLTTLKTHKNKKVRDNYLLWMAALESEVGNKVAVERIVKSTSINETVGVEIRLNWANDLLNIFNDEKGAEEIFNELTKTGASEGTLQTIEAIKLTALNIVEKEKLPKSKNENNIDAETVVSETKLNSSYPNPFNPTTTISYQLEERGFVNLVVYNSIGQEVAVLENRQREKGVQYVIFNASNLPSGIYIYRMQVHTPDGKGNYVKVKKMLLLR